MLGGLRVIKMFAWEAHFLRDVGAARGRELRHLRAQLLCNAAFKVLR